jgi:hypothetical protein
MPRLFLSRNIQDGNGAPGGTRPTPTPCCGTARRALTATFPRWSSARVSSLAIVHPPFRPVSDCDLPVPSLSPRF